MAAEEKRSVTLELTESQERAVHRLLEDMENERLDRSLRQQQAEFLAEKRKETR